MKLAIRIKAKKKPSLTLGDLLRQARGERTLREIEEETGISNAQISLLETGRTDNPSAKTLFRLIKSYKIPLEKVAILFNH